jgi:hypothetical protein
MSQTFGELPPGFEARRDLRTGRVYYVNHQRRTTQWEDPRPLPSGWERRVDPKTSRAFFVDHAHKVTSWNDPRPPLDPDKIITPPALPVAPQQALLEPRTFTLYIRDPASTNEETYLDDHDRDLSLNGIKHRQYVDIKYIPKADSLAFTPQGVKEINDSAKTTFIQLSQISEIRIGKHSNAFFREQLSTDQSRCFSIRTSEGRCVHLESMSEMTRNSFIAGVRSYNTIIRLIDAKARDTAQFMDVIDTVDPIKKSQNAIALATATGASVPGLTLESLYEEVLTMALVDKIITPDEDYKLNDLKRRWGITEQQHLTVLEKIGLSAQSFGEQHKDPTSISKPCVMCLDSLSNFIVWPCAHLCLCEECSEDYGTDCPVCREPVKEVKRVY